MSRLQKAGKVKFYIKLYISNLLIKIQQQEMNFQKSHPRSLKSTQIAAMEKISTFVTRFHSVLLPKANDSGVFRDLSEEQQYLLTNLDNDSPLHSILAGCLAIDSCLSNISQTEQNLTDNILKSLTNLCSAWQKIQNELIQSVQAKNLTVTKIEQLWKQIQESTKILLLYCHDLPFSEQNEQIKKQEKIMSQQDITFKLGSMKLFEQNQLMDLNTNIGHKNNVNQLKKQNFRLQQQLAYSEKKIIQLQLKVNKLNENKMRSKEFNYEEPNNQRLHIRKYSQTGNSDHTEVKDKYKNYVSPPSSSTIHEKQSYQLRDQIIVLEKTIKEIKEDHHKEKKKLMKEIRMLEEQLRNVENNQDRELIQLLQELQDEIQFLREQRRHDQRLINQIQQKLDDMNITRQSKIRKSMRIRQSRLATKASILRKQRQASIQTNQNERSPSFKKQKGRQRMFTANDQFSATSSISAPKNAQKIHQQQRMRFNWKQQRIGPTQDRYNRQYRQYKPERRNQRDDKQWKNIHKINNNYWSPQVRIGRAQSKVETKNEQNIRNIKRSLYDMPLVQSKHGKESFIKGEDKYPGQPSKMRKNQQQQHKLGGHQTERQERLEGPASSKALKWQQMTKNMANREIEPRLKTSRI